MGEKMQVNMKIIFDVKYQILRNSRERSPPLGNFSRRRGRERTPDVRLLGAVRLLHADRAEE